MTSKRVEQAVGVAALRKILGKNVKGFARLTGIPVDTLKSIESGRRRLSPEQGRKIQRTTGARPDSLLSAVPLTGYDAKGVPVAYTKEFFDRYRTTVFDLGEDKMGARRMAQELARSIGNWTKIIMLASVEEGRSTTFENLHGEIADHLSEIVKKYRLTNSIAGVLKAFPLTDSRTRTGADWRSRWHRSKESQRICVEYGITESRVRAMSDYEIYSFTRVATRRFHPRDVFQTEKGNAK